ncbi:hypothetical protein THAOC_36149 [Thalassiosira oceanica]|uniref:Uncharacterized protein n=1 Tax=Thalassiosira oceanica TaxID=159749 RepID=K0R0Q3_THAOC|nr:hypothetical protein THAOC_36149 [Thalassiosira oceanica]|eukprot:EJK45240.1 hypothetical protein THAOC_36149 [Thalassiosira oceanica]
MGCCDGRCGGHPCSWYVSTAYGFRNRGNFESSEMEEEVVIRDHGPTPLLSVPLADKYALPCGVRLFFFAPRATILSHKQKAPYLPRLRRRGDATVER